VPIALAWQDHAVVLVYLAGMIGLGVYLSRRQRTDEEYFLAGRRMPWFAVGVSVIASLLSSLTYLSEPGEVWNSGVTHVFGKMLAIPFEMVIVWVFCIPFMMRFRYTSAYEYLGHRFGYGSRSLGVALFVLMVVLWMGFVVLASARALAQVTDMPLWTVILTVGLAATVYTMLGGLKAVIWTDVVQVILLVGGGLFTIGFIAVQTGTWLPDWYQAAVDHLAQREQRHELPLFSFDPTVRATVITVALNMCIWHVCTHTANQMTVQRYFSTSDRRAARRSFVTASLVGVFLNLMLVVVGLAVLYFYFGQGIPVERGLVTNLEQHRDLIFPTFATHQLPPGVGGGILAALLAAAMSSIDSGVNSIATVLSVEARGRRLPPDGQAAPASHVTQARWITLAAGLFITFAAYGLDFLPENLGIVDAMPRTFNAVTAPLGGLFLVGMFVPSAGGRAAVAATICGLLTSLAIGYFHLYTGALLDAGLISQSTIASAGLLNSEGGVASLSFTWVMPCALTVTFVAAHLFSLVDSTKHKNLAGLTWRTRNETSPC